MLQSKSQNLLRRRTQPTHPRRLARRRKIRILTQQAVTRKHRPCSRLPTNPHQLLLPQITLRHRPRPNAKRLIRQRHMRRVRIRLRINRHTPQPQRLAGADGTCCDLSPIRYQNGRLHKISSILQSKISTSTGVGFHPLQGLFSCGQLEIKHTTSITARIST